MFNKQTTQGQWAYWPKPDATLSLLPLLSTSDTGDTYAAAVACITCRETPLTAEQAAFVQAQLSETWKGWHVWDRDQGTYPKPGDVLVDVLGNRWRVKKVDSKIFGNLYVCLCLREVQ